MAEESLTAEQPRDLPDPQRIESRAEHLLPEEKSAGSDDPHAQAAAILAESDRREGAREGERAMAPDTVPQPRTSDEVVDARQPPD